MNEEDDGFVDNLKRIALNASSIAQQSCKDNGRPYTIMENGVLIRVHPDGIKELIE